MILFLIIAFIVFGITIFYFKSDNESANLETEKIVSKTNPDTKIQNEKKAEDKIKDKNSSISDAGTPEIFNLMKQKGVALCPTLAAGDAITQYRGWKKGIDAEPDRIKNKRVTFKQALDAGVTICFGGDVGVFAHGDNARELEMMVEYGMKPINALRSATSINAQVFHQDKIGRVKTGFLADLIAVEGKPDQNISDCRKIKFVMKDGTIFH